MTVSKASTDVLSDRLASTLERFRDGQVTGLARAISVVENERPGFQELLHEIVSPGPSAARVGFTGPPGAGKSSLVAAVATAYRAAEERVGIVAVDPTSPYSGGALLGDRIRMNEIATDPGIFIRSMATRGSLGGLAATTKEVADLMDGFGFDRVVVETVGVGQTELEITAAADTVVVVLVPESGDSIQAMKAGLMEIADVFVVNKADRPGAARLVKELRHALQFRPGHGVKPAPEREVDGWTIPVLQTNAIEGDGVPDLLGAIDAHRAWMDRSGELDRRRRERAGGRIRDVVERDLRRTAWRTPEALTLLERGVEGIAGGSETPYSVARQILAALLR